MGRPHEPMSHVTSPAELKQRLEAERAGEPFVLYRDRDGMERLLRLANRPAATVGRAEACDICLEWDAQVSRVHAELRAVSGQWAIADDGLSRNGTYVNGERLSGDRRLRDGDEVEIGATLLLYREPARARLMTTAAADREPPPELTRTQRRVLLALCRPCAAAGAFATPASNQRIAEELHLSVPAVKTHLRALFERFEVSDLPQNEKRATLARLALERRAITPAELDT